MRDSELNSSLYWWNAIVSHHHISSHLIDFVTLFKILFCSARSHKGVWFVFNFYFSFLLTSLADFPCCLPLLTSLVDFSYCLPLLTSLVDFPCWLPLLTSLIDFSCWLLLLTSLVHFSFSLPFSPNVLFHGTLWSISFCSFLLLVNR